MKDVLICCTDAEGSQLEWLAKALFDTGWSVSFMHKGSSGVASAHCVIAVWSPKSVGDAWLMARAKTAAKRRRLVSIRLGGARPPRGLRSEQVIDLSDWPARGADRAMNTLLGSVDAVASGTAQRAADADGSKPWIALVVCAVLVGGGFVLFRVTEAPSGVLIDESRDSYAPSARAADAAAAAEHAMRAAAKAAESAKAAEGERVVDTDVVAAKPVAVMSDAARIGAQSLSQLAAAIDGSAIRLEDVRRAAQDALALDPQEPHARAVLAALRGLVDLQWADARHYAQDLDAGSSDVDLARIVGSLHALFGNSSGEALGQGANPAGAAERATDPLCGITDDAAFARAIVDLEGAKRITLLGSGCVVERIQRSPGVRAQLGLVSG